MRGHLQQRSPNTWPLKVFLGRDAAGKRRYLELSKPKGSTIGWGDGTGTIMDDDGPPPEPRPVPTPAALALGSPPQSQGQSQAQAQAQAGMDDERQRERQVERAHISERDSEPGTHLVACRGLGSTSKVMTNR